MTKRPHSVPRFYLDGFVDDVRADLEVPFIWLGSIVDNTVSRRAPKNLSVVNSYYDGRGGLKAEDATLEKHLSVIESDAATAIRNLVKLAPQANFDMPSEIGRFLAWQAARTPGWFDLVEAWANDMKFWNQADTVEPPPPGLENASFDNRPMKLMNPKTGEEVLVPVQHVEAHIVNGWKWMFSKQDRLELMHLQAWYFQVRHFPRLKWTRYTAPIDSVFITSDRAVSWLADGYADTPPAALRDATAEVYAPLAKKVALIGRNGVTSLGMTAREINMKVAFCASKWIAGPTKEIVLQALDDRMQKRERTVFH